jgi:cell division protein FtsQ
VTKPSTKPPSSRPPRVVSAGPRLAAKARAGRRDRRRGLLRRLAWVLTGVVPLLLLGWVLLGSSLLAVQHVVVAGEHRLTAAQVEAAAEVRTGTPLARLDAAGIARRVRSLGVIEQVTVSRSWPHTVKVTVVERLPFVAVPRAHGVLLLDDEGYPLATVATIPRGVVRLEVTDPARTDATTRAALSVLRGLPKTLRGALGSVRASSPEQVTLLLSGGRQVLWGGASDGSAKAAATLALLRMPGTFFDVSAPGVVTRR